jgi:hypothetical protein
MVMGHLRVIVLLAATACGTAAAEAPGMTTRNDKPTATFSLRRKMITMDMQSNVFQMFRSIYLSISLRVLLLAQLGVRYPTVIYTCRFLNAL